VLLGNAVEGSKRTSVMTVPNHSSSPSPLSVSSEQGGHPVFRAWGRLVLKYRWLSLMVMVGITAWMVLQVKTNLQIDNSIEAFTNNNSETTVNLEEVRDLFGRDSLFLVMVEGDVFSRPFLERLELLHHDLKNLNLDLPTLGQQKKDRDATRSCGASLTFSEDETAAETSVSPSSASNDSLSDDSFEDDDEHSFDDDEDGESEEDVFAGEGSIVEEMSSLINARRTWSEDRGEDEIGVLHVDKLMEPLPESENLATLKETVLSSPTLVGQVVDKEGRFAVLAVRTDFMSEDDSMRVHSAVVATMAKYDEPGFSFNVAGMPALASALNRVMLRDLRVLLIFSLIAQFLLLAWLFRHPIGIAGPMLVVIVAVLWSLGIMTVFCMPMTMLTNVMPAFLICVGMGDAIHLLSVYRQARQRENSNHDAIVYAVATTGMPILFTSLTTMAGLLSFRFSTVSAVGDMGTASAFGVFVAFINSLVLLPVLLTFNKKSLLGLKPKAAAVDGSGRRFDVLGRILAFLARLSGSVPGMPAAQADRRRRGTLLAMLLLFVVAGLGASRLGVWHDPLSWIPGDRAIKRAFVLMDDHVGGTVSVLAVIKAKGDHTVKDREILRGMEKLEEHVRQYKMTTRTGEPAPLVGNTTSVLDFVKETNRAMTPDSEAGDAYRLPEDQGKVSQFVEQFSWKAPAQSKHIISIDEKATVMMLRSRWMEATSYGPFTQSIEEAAQKFMPQDKVLVTLSGSIYTLFTTVSSLIWNLLRSFSIAFGVITVLMILTFRSFKLGIIAMVPNLLPILCILGIMGFAGIPIDMANLLIASIALGVAVDDTIHFLHHWRVHYRQTKDVDASIQYSFEHSGRAMMSTTMILTVGFFVYMASSMQHMQRFGMLIGLTVIFALVIDLIMAPAILRTLYKNKKTDSVVHS